MPAHTTSQWRPATADQQKIERLLANDLNKLTVTSFIVSDRKTVAVRTQVLNQTEYRVQSISHEDEVNI